MSPCCADWEMYRFRASFPIESMMGFSSLERGPGQTTARADH